MRSAADTDDAGVLERLHEHELVLDQHLEEARERARESMAQAQERAERLRIEAEQALASELDDLRSASARELASIGDRSRGEVEQRRGELEERFRARREAAVAFALGLLLGEELP